MPTYTRSSDPTDRAQRDTRLNLRASTQQQQLIRRAAAALDKSVTDFVLDSATVAAEQILADRRWFMLDDDQWERFQELLDAPVTDSPKLRKLLSQPTVFDDEDA
jgi:uncharacterized protein (DUF1778 family)